MGDAKAFELLLEQRRPLNFERIWDAVWRAPSFWVIVRYATALLRYVDFNISDKLEAIEFECKDNKMDYDLDFKSIDSGDMEALMMLCYRRTLLVLAMESTVKIILRRGDENFLEAFMDH